VEKGLVKTDGGGDGVETIKYCDREDIRKRDSPLRGKDEDIEKRREEGVMKEKSKGIKESKKVPQKSLVPLDIAYGFMYA